MAIVERYTETRVAAVALGTPLLLCRANPSRVWLGIAGVGMGAQLGVSTRPDANTGNSWSFSTGSVSVPPFKLTLKDDGTLVQQEWYGVSAAVAPAIAAVVIEVFREDTGSPASKRPFTESAGGVLLSSNGLPQSADRAALLRRQILGVIGYG